MTSPAQEIVKATGEHMVMVAIALVAATTLGLALGIFCARNRRAGRVALKLTDIVQTIPSLALFGFLIPIPFIGGIGARTAILALVLYLLLPIVRSTVTGIQGVPFEIRDAGMAMGMTSRQLLWGVELPLALPSLLNGIRIALVTGIGLATIAAAVGAGGLGTFIFRGVAMVDSRTILQGAIPAALLAIASDLLMSFIERRAEKWAHGGGRG